MAYAMNEAPPQDATAPARRPECAICRERLTAGGGSDRTCRMQMPCCRTTIHTKCLAAWLSDDRRRLSVCPCCAGEESMLTLMSRAFDAELMKAGRMVRRLPPEGDRLVAAIREAYVGNLPGVWQLPPVWPYIWADPVAAELASFLEDRMAHLCTRGDYVVENGMYVYRTM
jgi:hypothetical protein